MIPTSVCPQLHVTVSCRIRKSDALFWPLGAPVLTCTHTSKRTCMHTYIRKTKTNLKKKDRFFRVAQWIKEISAQVGSPEFGLQDPHKNGSNLTHLIHVCAVVCAFPHQKPNNNNK